MNYGHIWTRTLHMAIAAIVTVFQIQTAAAATLNLSDVPLFLNQKVPPLNMLVLGRDHKLYYEAYNDYTDLNDDDVLDIGYKGYVLKSPVPDAPESPYKIDYYGYFDSFKCYVHDTARFNPTRVTTNKMCGGAGEWSGDFLNYLTTARIDALRKVLYGGFRSTDSNGLTILERSHIPQDAHSWGKEYSSTATNGYDIRQYTPYSQPTAGTRHLFANTTLLNTTAPLLRVLTNRAERIWNWVSIERPVAGGRMNNGGSGPVINPAPTDIPVRVAVCVTNLLEPNCQRYTNGNYKPIGLLQEFGENDSMYFGLISGSYAKNTSGGVLRRAVNSISEEIDLSTGIFRNGVYKNSTLTANKGIITTLNRLRTTGFGGSYSYDAANCGWTAASRSINESECQMWGNPVGEMMYESARYFAGKGSPTSAFNIAYGAGEESQLTGAGLPVDSWDNPYSSRAACSKPFETVVSDINPSYDTDQLPGTAFGSFTGDLSGLNVATLGQTIWNTEFGAAQNIFIGQSGALNDGAPTVKSASSFGNIRGLSPEEPTKNGGYYSASVAYYGRTTDLNAATGDQKLSTFSVALASPLPKIEIPVNGRKITLVPFAKSVNGAGINAAGTFQPTDQIVDFYVDTLTPTYGKFRVNFEDVEQGADHDMDAITVYEYTVSGNDVTVKLTSEYAAGGITQHMGYVISGTDNKDGIYLEVVDQRDGDVANDTDYFLDTPPAFTGKPPAPNSGAGRWNDGVALPFVTSRVFTPGSTAGAQVLKDPLWYAAKWGGFDESFRDAASRNNIPDFAAEWDENGDGDPDNYFLVTNALKLSKQLRSAFEEIILRTSSASSASVNSGSISSDSRVYQAKFDSGVWTGQLLSFPVNPTDGSLLPSEWDASMVMPAHGSRSIITTSGNTGAAVPFRWADIGTVRQAQLQLTDTAAVAQQRLNYLRGDGSLEKKNGGTLRDRPYKLGDIVSSSPIFVGRPPFFYSDLLETASYSAFVAAQASRRKMVYVGANDGMLHAFDAVTGVEQLAFIPGAVFPNLNELTKQSYTHKYFVDGSPTMADVFYGGAWHTVLVGGLNKGGQGIYALDITNPDNFSEANAASTVLWEFKDADGDLNLLNNDIDLGYTFSKPAVVRMRNGRWAAVFGNGYNNSTPDGLLSTSLTGNAVLYIVDIETGNLIRKIDTRAGSLTTPNGLASPAAVDANGDSKVDYIYAGDLLGNLWKFDVTSANPAQWDVAYDDSLLGIPLNKYPLYTALDSSGNRQPITSRPQVGRGPEGAGMVVLFGTGKFMEMDDKVILPRRDQTFYGILDPNTGTSADRGATRASLTQQTIIAEQSFTFPILPTGTMTRNLRVTSDNSLGGNRGWYIDLLSPPNPPGTYRGERQVSDSILRNNRVLFTTLIPDADPCSPGGGSWLMEMNALNGARLATTPFDNNRDGNFNDSDLVTVTINGVQVKVAITGLQSEVGIMPKPGILSGDGVDHLYLPGSMESESGDNMQTEGREPGANAKGRQSWRQVR